MKRIKTKGTTYDKKSIKTFNLMYVDNFISDASTLKLSVVSMFVPPFFYKATKIPNFD